MAPLRVFRMVFLARESFLHSIRPFSQFRERLMTAQRRKSAGRSAGRYPPAAAAPYRIIEVHRVVVDADHPYFPPRSSRSTRLALLADGEIGAVGLFGGNRPLATASNWNRYWFTSARSRNLWRQVASSTSGNLSHTSSGALAEGDAGVVIAEACEVPTGEIQVIQQALSVAGIETTCQNSAG